MFDKLFFLKADKIKNLVVCYYKVCLINLLFSLQAFSFYFRIKKQVVVFRSCFNHIKLKTSYAN